MRYFIFQKHGGSLSRLILTLTGKERGQVRASVESVGTAADSDELGNGIQ